MALGCAICHRRDNMDFHVPRHLWVAAVPRYYVKKRLCLRCFDALAIASNVLYKGFLRAGSGGGASVAPAPGDRGDEIDI